MRMGDRMKAPVLVLNSTYEPINVTTARRAIVLILKGTARPEEVTSRIVRSAHVAIPIPSVIRLLEYVHVPFERKELSRKNVLLRDGYTCQYCGRRFPSSELTVDHVIPRSKGGRTSWDNVVAGCRRCNVRKGNRTPEEAGMTLLKHPRALSWRVSHQILAHLGRQQEAWRKYLLL
jgi:5-methylcytosine-specific restriction endonuclease McrA